MKKKYLLLLLSLPLLFISGCKDKDEEVMKSPPPSWGFHFYFSDSAGNNLLPYNLPDNPIVDPESYRAYCGFESEKFRYKYNRHKELGYRFFFGDNLYNIIKSETYSKDTLYKVRFCFDNKCDTITFKLWVGSGNPDVANGTEMSSCGAKWLVYRGDTIHNQSCVAFPIINY